MAQDSFLDSAGFSRLDQLLKKAYHKNREIASGWKHWGENSPGGS
jgi:hypothetical protein